MSVCICLYVVYFRLQLDGHQIRPGKKLKVNPSIPNSRLFVGNIPKSKSKDDIMQEFAKVVGEYHLLSYDTNVLFSDFHIACSFVKLWLIVLWQIFFSVFATLFSLLVVYVLQYDQRYMQVYIERKEEVHSWENC